MAVKIPIPQSSLSYIDDRSGRISREWYQYLESLGVSAAPISSLPVGRIWIGDAASTPIAHVVSGDITLSSVGVAILQATANTAEIAQDAVGTILTDTATIDFTYTDATPAITADVKAGSIGSAQLGSAWATFTPTRTGWTDVGTPTVTGRRCQIGNVAYFQVKVVPATSIATTAGTSYIALPIAAGASAIGGDASMQDITTNIAVGNCVIDAANSRVYVPTQVASGNTFTICGSYEA